MSSHESSADGGRRRPRGRPRRGAEGPLLSRELIAEKALEIAGVEGFSAVTMQRLADETRVTPRALYNHIADRDEVIELAAGLMLEQIPPPRLDPRTWRASLLDAYREGRAAYRRFPRALLISLEETLTGAAVHPRRITLAEDMLGFFVAIGLSERQAQTAQLSFLIDLFGFVLLVDHPLDRSAQRVEQPAADAGATLPVPRPWLDEHPETPAPISRRAAAGTPPSADEMFEDLIALRVEAVANLVTEH